MSFFQDLPTEYKEKIFNSIKSDLLESGAQKKYIQEITDDFINCQNTEENVSQWVNDYCLK